MKGTKNEKEQKILLKVTLGALIEIRISFAQKVCSPEV